MCCTVCYRSVKSYNNTVFPRARTDFYVLGPAFGNVTMREPNFSRPSNDFRVMCTELLNVFSCSPSCLSCFVDTVPSGAAFQLKKCYWQYIMYINLCSLYSLHSSVLMLTWPWLLYQCWAVAWIQSLLFNWPSENGKLDNSVPDYISGDFIQMSKSVKQLNERSHRSDCTEYEAKPLILCFIRACGGSECKSNGTVSPLNLLCPSLPDLMQADTTVTLHWTCQPRPFVCIRDLPVKPC